MKRKAWKLLPLILTGAFLLCGAGCGGEGQTTTYSPSLPEAQKDDYTLYLEDTFNNNADLSDCQGYRNWYYYCGDPEDDSLSLMVFNDYYGRWCSKYQQIYYFTYLWSRAWLPEDQQGYGIGMSFKAPATGTVHITATVRLLAEERFNSGDGVVFTISDKRGDPYDGVAIAPENGAKDFVLEKDIEIAMGSEILFMVFPNTSNQNDFTDVDITIKYIRK